MSPEEPTLEFEHEFSKRFLHDALKRDVIWRLWVLVGALLVAVAGIGWLLGTPPWQVPIWPALAAGALAGAIAIPLKFRSLVNRTFDYWERLAPTRKISYRLFPDAIEVTMPNGTARYPWQGMRRLWRYPDIWLLEVVKMNSVLLPHDAPAAARDYVVERCREAGVRVAP